MNIKSVDTVAKKYASRGAAAAPEYTDGVSNPRNDWATAAAGASTTYAQGVQQAIQNNSFQKGVNAAGSDKWQRKAKTVGAVRYAPGVQAAQGDYSKGVSPYLDTLRNLTLPPRAPKGDPSNINRVQAIANAMRQQKLGK